MEVNKRVLAICAHPDDVEFMCSGTLSLMHDLGWEVHIATMTPGDGGSNKLNREEISKVRRVEAANAAKMLDGEYHCLECEDVFIMNDKPTLRKAIHLLREVRPSVVFAPSPNDYFMDHENTSHVVRTACFACGIPNVEFDDVQPLEEVPCLYYVDVLDGVDIFGKAIVPEIYVDITKQIELKHEMLCCHASQRDWLLEHHGVDEYTISMKRIGENRGEEIGVKYAEAFRQHLGHAYPKNNVLKEVLGELVVEKTGD